MPGLKERAKTLVELLDSAYYLYAARPLSLDDKAAALLGDDGARSASRPCLPALEALTDWTPAAPRRPCARFAEAPGLKLGQVGAAAARGADRPRDLAGAVRRDGGARARGEPRPPARPERVPLPPLNAPVPHGPDFAWAVERRRRAMSLKVGGRSANSRDRVRICSKDGTSASDAERRFARQAGPDAPAPGQPAARKGSASP